MNPQTYKKLVATQVSSDFKSAIKIITLPLRELTNDEIIIQNKFAGVNAGFDTLLSQGKIPYFKPTPPFELGVEAVGEVVAVGKNITTFKIGDTVATTVRGGGYSEYQVIDANLAIKVPQATPEILTLIPTGISALVALEQVGEMTNQETILVTAAAGGTGHIAVQLAKLAGNHVIGTCGSEAKANLLKKLGCDRVINYRTEDVDEVLQREYPKGINLVFECVGRKMFDICVNHLAIRGRLIVVGFISEYADQLEIVNQPRIYQKLFWKGASVRGFLMPLYQEYSLEARNRLFHLLESGQIQVAIDPTEFRGIESIDSAVDYLLAGKSCGKVVITF
ncbi:zinc-binding dehydrogenase [Lyngbya sp. PCC 8106]|uniref:zinc-binding dehydrogenase n=1 Tax=Lyngbya sp. (strain PCC 8106) TaxID=313612 RepID=UPI0000EACA08|nr:zinc-binding dehydrogenase [Lyngbya sp. PCC 8106]EAW37888.1 oxidoreductase [Lyngbya sp. PCC 8106]